MREMQDIQGSTWRRPSRTRVATLRRQLAQYYGVPVIRPHGDPLGELILTVLSQSTNDRNRDVAFLRLRERFSSWADVHHADTSEVEEAIRPGGISKVKSQRIKDILAAIGEPFDLEWMRSAPVAKSRDYLCTLPGVGRKTAACVLLFSYGLRDIPVDTHVSRVGMRLGILPTTKSFDLLHDEMLAITPQGAEWELHLNILRHGRRICHARNPDCASCPLSRICLSFQSENSGENYRMNSSGKS